MEVEFFMFYVVNKSKIYSYLIALCTVVILFVAATTINDMATPPTGNIVETDANIVGENNVNSVKKNGIGNVVKQESTNTENDKIGNEMQIK